MRVLALSLFAFVLAGVAGAQVDPVRGCTQTMDADVAIRACSALLEGGTLSKQEQVRAYTQRAHAYHKKKDYASSIDDHGRAIALDPKNADAFVRRGRVLFELSLELVASALPSGELAERAMAISREAEADLRKACSLKGDCTEIEAIIKSVVGSRSILKGHEVPR